MNYIKILLSTSALFLFATSSFAQTYLCEYQVLRRETRGSKGIHQTFSEQTFPARQKIYLEINLKNGSAQTVGSRQQFHCEIVNEKEPYEKLLCLDKENTVDLHSFYDSTRSRERNLMFQIIRNSGEFYYAHHLLWNSKPGKTPDYKEPGTYLQEETSVGACFKQTPKPLW